MTDRLDGLTVVFEREIRIDDAQCIIDAVKMIKGVADVKPVISTPETYHAAYRAKLTLLEELREWLMEQYQK